MTKIEKNKFASKIDEMYFVIVQNKTPINKLMCDTLITQLSSSECYDFINGPDNVKNHQEINNIKEKIYECTIVQMPNTIEHNTFVVIANKVCGSMLYNKNVIDEINSNFDSLLSLIILDPRIIQKVNNQDDKFYIKLLNFLNTRDVIKVFKYMPPNVKTISVCKHAIHLDYNCIKYVDNMINENICDMAIAMGHTNLEDIPQIYCTESIYKKYIDVNPSNLKFVEHNLKISNKFFFDLIKQDINNVMFLNDPLSFSVDLCTYIVNKNGLFIKYLPPKFQTLRILELAIKQNTLARYYVTYNCITKFDSSNLDWLTDKCLNAVKKIRELSTQSSKDPKDSIFTSKHTKEFLDSCTNLIEQNLNTKTGILIQKKSQNTNFYVMTGENYLNHQYRLYYDSGYIPNIDVIESTVNFNTKTSNKTQKVITEVSSSFVDSNKNSYVVFFEIVS